LKEISKLTGFLPKINSTKNKTTANPIYKNPHYDLSDIVFFMDNDIVAVKKVLATFHSNTEYQIKEWKKAISEKNHLLLQNLAHKMYPMFMQINAVKVSKQLKKMDREKIMANKLFLEAKKTEVEIIKTMKDLETFIS